MEDEAFAPYLTWLGFSALIGSMTIRLVDLWRLHVERAHNAAVARDKTTAGDLSYPWLAQHPVWIGIVVGVVAFAAGVLVISGYRQAQRYWAATAAGEMA